MKKLLLTIFIFLGFQSIPVNAQVNLQDSLQFYLPFTGGDVNDASGNGYTGISYNVTGATDRFGVAGNAYEIPNINTTVGYIDYDDILDQYTTGTNAQFTISVWIKRNRVTALNDAILSKQADGSCNYDGGQQLVLRIYNDNLNFTYTDGFGFNQPARYVSGVIPVTDTSKWYHLLVTVDMSVSSNDGLDKIALYVDCIRDSSRHGVTPLGTQPLQIQNGTAHLGLGNGLNSSGAPCSTNSNSTLNGAIDDVRFYNRILNQQEIQALCSDTLAATAITKTPEELLKEQVIIYPNPSRGELNFKNITMDQQQVQIYNLQGQLVGQHQLQQQLQINYLPDGMYLINVINKKTGMQYSQKVRLQR